MRDALELVYPSLDHAKGYLAARAEGFRDSSSGSDTGQVSADTLADHLMRLQRHGKPLRLADGTIDEPMPFGHFWVVAEDAFVGRVGIRYHLNRTLRRSGGHVGYEIRPSLRRRGYGHAALALGRAHLAIHGRHDLLVTCGEGNLGSRRIIESAGATLEDIVMSPDGSGQMIRRYWFGTPVPERPWPGLASESTFHTSVKRSA
jgi:predicted acetyltransferase